MSSRGGEGRDLHHADDVDGTVRADGLVGFAVRRRVTVAMVTVSMLLFGLIALGNLKVNLLPASVTPDRAHETRVPRPGIGPSQRDGWEESLGWEGTARLKSGVGTGRADVVPSRMWARTDRRAGGPRQEETLQLPSSQTSGCCASNPATRPFRHALTDRRR